MFEIQILCRERKLSIWLRFKISHKGRKKSPRGRNKFAGQIQDWEYISDAREFMEHISTFQSGVLGKKGLMGYHYKNMCVTCNLALRQET